jgi:hypothetical protein
MAILKKMSRLVTESRKKTKPIRNQVSERVDYYDETEARKDVGELEGEFEGEDGDSEEP